MSTVVKEGVLKKKGRLNPQLQERRFFLVGHMLQYYEATKLKGEIDVRGAKVTIKDIYTFQLDAENRSYLLQANSEAEMKDWVNVLQSHIATLPVAPSKMSKRDMFKQAFTSKTSRTDRNTKAESVRETKNDAPYRDDAAPPASPYSPEMDSPSISPSRTPSRSPSIAPSTHSIRSEVPSISQQMSSDEPAPRESALPQPATRSASPPFPSIPSPNPAPSPSSSSKRRSVFFSQSSSSSLTGDSRLTSSESVPAKTTFDTFPDEVTSVDILKKGNLRKRGEVNMMFKERVFILTKSGHFAYFDERMLRKGIISLYNRSLMLSSTANFEWKLLPNESGGREYVLRANTQSEMSEWIAVISSAMEQVSKLMRARTRVSLAPLNPNGGGGAALVASTDTPVRTGILLKKGKRPTSLWRERSVKLFRSHLEYYEGVEMKGRIDLAPSHRVAISDETHLEFCIEPADGVSRVYLFRCRTRPELDAWVERLRQSVRDLSSSRQSVLPPPARDMGGVDPNVGESDPFPSSSSSSINLESLAELSGSTSNIRKSILPPSASASSAAFPNAPAPVPAATSAPSMTLSADLLPDSLEELPVLEEIEVNKGEVVEEVEEVDGVDDKDDTPPTRRPKWVPDEAHEKCMLCKVDFTLTVRKHHCRSCGRLLCAECTPSLVAIPALDYPEPVRVCIKCIDRFYRHAPKQTNEGCVIA